MVAAVHATLGSLGSAWQEFRYSTRTTDRQRSKMCCFPCCSGLDSTTALQLVESLHSLAAGGRAIITTIHQPSARLYGLLDKLLLLAEGRPLYYGKARRIQWLSCMPMHHHPLPPQAKQG